MEVFNNIFDHSSSKVNGFILGQFFEKSNKFSFSVCDLGVGIPYRLNHYRVFNQGLDPLQDHLAILDATKLGVSSQTNPRNRGFGLNSILEITEQNKGKLRILSSSGLFEKDYNKNLYLETFKNIVFLGTLIRIDISLDCLEELDFTESLHDFDF
jgi:sensor histidine kinase regulating citrate/malate metabolism